MTLKQKFLKKSENTWTDYFRGKKQYRLRRMEESEATDEVNKYKKTLYEQVLAAQEELESWSESRINNCQLEGTDPFLERNK